MTTTNDKLRSLILSALMVFSVFAGSVAFAGTAAANHAATGDNADAHLDSGSTYWQGQELFFQNSSATEGDTYQVREWNAGSDAGARVGGLEEEFTLNENKAAVIDTSSLDGDFVVVDENGDVQDISDGEASLASSNSDGVWEVTSQTFSAEFEDDSTTDDSTLDLTMDSNRGTYSVNVSSDDLDDDELESIFNTSDNSLTVNNADSDDGTITLADVSDGTYTTDFTDVPTGNNTFDFEVTDTSASSSHSVNVSNAEEGDVTFADDVVQDEAGDVVEITVQMENTEDGTITIGNSEKNYWITGELSEDADDGDGKVTVKFNTYAAGASNVDNSSKLYTASDSDDSVEVVDEGGAYLNNNNEASDKLLGATEYEMNVTHTSGDQAVGALSLQERKSASLSTWTAPKNMNLDDAETISAGIGTNVTESSEIANGDFAVFNLKAEGFEGLWALEGSDAATVLNNNETTFSIAHTNPGANADGEDLNLGSNNLTVYPDGDNNTYFIAVDTGGNLNDKDGRDYESNFTVKDGSVLNTHDDDNKQVTTSDFGITEGESELDTNQNDMIVVEASENQSITGTSSWAPGTELSVTIKSKDTTSPFFTKPTADVGPNGTVEFKGDFGKLAPGTNLTFQLEKNDKVDGKVVEQKSETTATATPDNSTATPTPTATATDEPTDASTDESTDDSTEQTTEGSGPGFTIVAALGALIAAALLAARRSN